MHRQSAELTLPRLPELHDDLLAWFALHRRDLPWRRHRTLYGTWISEMMLQQTTVATVVPYWERFLVRFPDVDALAAAPLEDVLALWSGLGYYTRARHLHAAAVQVSRQLQGRLPQDFDGWRRLPGVGPYAAGAIASIGLGLREPAVDANVRRVLTRLACRPEPVGPPAPRALETLARALVPAANAGAWNEALMELGATVCTPRQPACPTCPVASHCGTRTHGLEPAPGPAPARPDPIPVRAAMAALLWGDRIWLEAAGGPAVPALGPRNPARDDFGRLHQGLLTLPMSAWFPESSPGPASPLELAWRPWPGTPSPGCFRPAGAFRHAITRYRLTVDVLVLRVGAVAETCDPTAPEGRPGGIWSDLAAARDLHVSQLARKALRCVRDGRG